MSKLTIEPTGKIKICLVDEDAGICNVYQEVLQEAGYEVTTAANYDGLLAQMISGYNPDIVIVDEVNAGPQLKLAEKLRLERQFSGLIVLFYGSVWESDEQRQHIDAFIQKMDGPETLLMVIKVTLIQLAVLRLPGANPN